jgi:hypothetical protein
MRIRLLILSALLVAAPAVAAPAHAQPAKARACTTGTMARTSSYLVALKLGPRQEMYMPSEVQARKIKTGQVMLGGSMEMVEPGKGLSDYHYGNDVLLKPGGKVTVIVTVKGQRATFHATAPKSSGSSTGMSMS